MNLFIFNTTVSQKDTLLGPRVMCSLTHAELQFHMLTKRRLSVPGP